MTKPHPESDPRLIADIEDGQAGEEDASSPERLCAVMRTRQPKEAMVRFVLSPDGVVVPDVAARLPGRGVWISASRAAVDAAAKGVFPRAFKAQARVPDDLADTVERLLLRRCTDLIGLARKAGQAVCGSDQVREALKGAAPAMLLEASDGAADGRNKLYFLAKGLYGQVKVAGALSAQELGMAFGRGHVIHGLVRRGALAENWETAYRRLAGFRQAPEHGWFPEPDR
jgi:uncharacterized protein